MGKTKKVNTQRREEVLRAIASAPKQKPLILSRYKPVPRFKSGCTDCY